jgi:type I restriction enzyme M protein
MFYNTGIATYIWVLTNRKPEARRGKVQLIDGTGIFTPLRKNLGKKNCELSDAQVRQLTNLFLSLDEDEHSKIFPNAAFGYWKVTVERPLRLAVDLAEKARSRLRRICEDAGEAELADAVDIVADRFGEGPRLDYNAFVKAADIEARQLVGKLTGKREKLLREALTRTDEAAQPVVKKVSTPSKTEEDALHGLYAVHIEGKPRIVEYEADTSLRDTEQVPLLEEGGIEAFFRREVLPHVPDAWIDASKTQIGYEISFTRHFYKPTPLRSLDKIRADLEALQDEAEGLIDRIVEGT